MPLIHSNDCWSKLREVWLGDVYPANFYDHLDSEIRDVFYQITEWTKSDLDAIEKKLQEFGVIVQRPKYESIDDHLDRFGHLVKPEITPRDYFVVIGNRLFSSFWKKNDKAWQHLFEYYGRDPDSEVFFHKIKIVFSGANTVRVGRDIFVDCVWSKQNNHTSLENIEQYFHEEIKPLFPGYRMHYLDNGGHVDGCFAVLKPGHLLANQYFDDYDRTFPGWKRLMLSDPTFRNNGHYDPKFNRNGKFWLPNESMVATNKSLAAFNTHVNKYALDWVGNYTETFFEVNCLMVDEKNVVVLGENESVFRYLESIGITAHSVPFRCRTFWDGGLHCLTLDIRRDGMLKDYFTGTNGTY